MKEFNKVIGYDAVKNELIRICDILVNSEKYKKFGVKAPQGLLLYGEPGVGKTLMANCFIKATKRKCFVCRKSKGCDDFLEELSNVFEEAKANAPSIVFLDDMDKFANEGEENSDATEYVAVQVNIDLLGDSDVYVVATANDIECFPESLIRDGRFGKCIEIEKPVGKDSEKIMNHYLSLNKNIEKFNFNDFAKILNGMTCAELEAIINEAGMYAAFDGKDIIEKNDMIRACLRKLYKAPEDNLYLIKNPQEAKRIAYHEAGHTVIAEILRDESISLVSISNHLGNIGGITKNYFDEDSCWVNFDFKINAIKSILGGKAASEIVFGEVDIGADKDIASAFNRVEDLIDDKAMLGFEYFSSRSDGDEKRDKLSLVVSNEVEKLYKIAKKILIDNREFLDKLANALLEKNVLLMSDIQDIKKSCNIVR